MDRSPSLNLKPAEIAASFEGGDWAKLFPPVLTMDQAAALLQISKDTLYAWRSQGRLNGCSRRVGKHVRIYRDRLLTTVFN
jgi:excisionase family DNA binding protein